MVDISTFSIPAILYDVKDFDVSKILLVTDSGAGAPLARLYLIPTSCLGPESLLLASVEHYHIPVHVPLTTRIMTCGEQNTTSSLSFPNDMAGSWRAEYSVLTDQYLLHAVSGTDLGDQLDQLRVVEASISSNDQKTARGTLGDGKDYAGDEGFAIMRLLEYGGLFTKS